MNTTTSPAAVFAGALIRSCLNGDVPVAAGSINDVARACGWMVARAAEALCASEQPRELLGAALVLTRADLDRAGYTPPPASPPGEPHPATVAVWLVELEAAGAHDLVDAVMTTFLSIDLPGRAGVLAMVTAHLLRLVGPELTPCCAGSSFPVPPRHARATRHHGDMAREHPKRAWPPEEDELWFSLISLSEMARADDVKQAERESRVAFTEVRKLLNERTALRGLGMTGTTGP